MLFAKTIISSVIALACIAAPVAASASQIYFLGDKNTSDMPRPERLAPDQRMSWSCPKDKDGEWQQYRCKWVYKEIPAPEQAAVDTAAQPAGKSCNYVPNLVRYAPPGSSPNDPCNPTQVDKHYTLTPNDPCNHTVNGAQMCAWTLVGSTQAAGQQYVQQPVLRCPMGYDRLPNGDCYLGSGGFLWVYPGRAIYVGYGYGYGGYYGYSNYGYYNYSRGYSYHPSSRDAPSACSSFGDYHRNGGRAVGRC